MSGWFARGELACSALSRWPWRKHHLAFLITHLGIITLRSASIGRGERRNNGFSKAKPNQSAWLINASFVRDIDGIVKGYPAEFCTIRRRRSVRAILAFAKARVCKLSITAPVIEGN
jgi:hypothetical protein